MDIVGECADCSGRRTSTLMFERVWGGLRPSPNPCRRATLVGMSRRLVSLIGVMLVAALGGAVASSALKPPPAASVRPRAFASCPALVSYAKANLARTHGVPETPILALGGPVVAPVAKGVGVATPGAVSSAAAAGGDNSSPAAEAYSTTNDQEVGVDEPDIVKTDGSTIFTVSGTKIEALSVSGTPKLVGSLDLGSTGYNAQLLLRGNRLIVDLPAGAAVPAAAGPDPGRTVRGPQLALLRLRVATTQLTEVDVSDPSRDVGHPDAAASTAASSTPARPARAPASSSRRRRRRSRCPPLAGRRPPGWVPTSRFKDVRTGRHFVRPVAACSDDPPPGRLLRARDAVDRHASTSTRASASRTPTR